MSIIGPLWGGFLAVLTLLWLDLNQGRDRDANVEIMLMIAMPFLVFYTA